jgi:hypothetical protein
MFSDADHPVDAQGTMSDVLIESLVISGILPPSLSASKSSSPLVCQRFLVALKADQRQTSASGSICAGEVMRDGLLAAGKRLGIAPQTLQDQTLRASSGGVLCIERQGLVQHLKGLLAAALLE